MYPSPSHTGPTFPSPSSPASSHLTLCPLSPSSPASSTSTLVGARTIRLRDLKILLPLGKGAHGRVYSVRDLVTKENMALKVVPKLGMRGHGLHIQALLAEQKALSFLSESPWFLTLNASWSDTNNFYFAMVCSVCLMSC